MARQPNEYYSELALLKLTGQEHPKDYKYDRVISLYYKIGKASISCVAACGINEEENRIVDIAVHPEFRRLGLGRTLVELSECTVAYSVTSEAMAFWQGIGWKYDGTKEDKDTWVYVYRKVEK